MSNKPKRKGGPSRQPARPATAQSKRPPILAIAIGAIILVAAIGVAIAVSGEERDDDRLAWGRVSVTGEAFPRLEDTGEDPAIGQPAPVVFGVDPDGNPMALEPGEPTLVAVLAHWCPVCNAELPLLVDMAEQGAFDDIRTVAVLTDTQRSAPNFPPARWLDDKGWTGDVIVDDEDKTLAATFGVSGYPFLLAFDAEGTLVARDSGQLPEARVQALVDAAKGT